MLNFGEEMGIDIENGKLVKVIQMVNIVDFIDNSSKK